MILVIGATGNVGKELVPQLIENGTRVRVLVRAPNKALRFSPGAECVHGDLDDPDTLRSAMEGVSAVYVIAFHTKQIENVISAAKAAWVKHLVRQSTIEAGAVPPIGPGRWHRDQEQLIERSGIAWTHIRPTYDITGPETLTIGEMVESLARALDRPIQYVDVPEPAAGEWMIRKQGFSPVLARALVETLGALRSSRFADVADTVQRLTGREARSYEAWCRENSEASIAST